MWWAIHDVSQMLRQLCFIKTHFDAEQKTPLTSVFHAISIHSKNKWPGSSHGYLPALCPICCDGNITARFLMQCYETCWSSRNRCLNTSSPVSAQAAVKHHSVGTETEVKDLKTISLTLSLASMQSPSSSARGRASFPPASSPLVPGSGTSVSSAQTRSSSLLWV